MNRLLFFDEAGMVVGDVVLGRLDVGVDGVIGASPTTPAPFPVAASSCQLLTNGAVIGEGAIACTGRLMSVNDLDREFVAALEVQRRQAHSWLDGVFDQIVLDHGATAPLLRIQPDDVGH